MALTTVSSLSESFVSGAPVVAEEMGLAKGNADIPLSKVGPKESPTEATIEENKIHS